VGVLRGAGIRFPYCSDRCDKAVAPARDGNNAPCATLAIANGLAQGCDVKPKTTSTVTTGQTLAIRSRLLMTSSVFDMRVIRMSSARPVRWAPLPGSAIAR
jgi:hypothetical protein